jgi:hypothetical protein
MTFVVHGSRNIIQNTDSEHRRVLVQQMFLSGLYLHFDYSGRRNVAGRQYASTNTYLTITLTVALLQWSERRTCDPELPGSTFGRSTPLLVNRVFKISGVDEFVGERGGTVEHIRGFCLMET